MVPSGCRITVVSPTAVTDANDVSLFLRQRPFALAFFSSIGLSIIYVACALKSPPVSAGRRVDTARRRILADNVKTRPNRYTLQRTEPTNRSVEIPSISEPKKSRPFVISPRIVSAGSYVHARMYRTKLRARYAPVSMYIEMDVSNVE